MLDDFESFEASTYQPKVDTSLRGLRPCDAQSPLGAGAGTRIRQLTLRSAFLMLTKNRPLQVACWALMMAFGLTLIAATTDPAGVRRTILAKAERTTSHVADESTLIVDVEGPHPDHVQSSTPANTTFASAQKPNSRDETVNIDSTRPARRGPSAMPSMTSRSVPSTGESWTVSSSRGERVIFDRSSPEPSRTDFVVSPEQLRTDRIRTKQVELLPPPPELALRDEDPWQPVATEPTLPPHPSTALDIDTGHRALDVELGHQVAEEECMSETKRLVAHLERLLNQQQQLIERQQHLPIERMHEVVDQLHRQLATIDKSFPPTPRDPKPSAGTSIDESAQLIGEISPSGTGRLTLKVANAKLDDIIELLERLSGTQIATLPTEPSAAASHRSDEQPQPSLPTATNQIEIRPLTFK